MGFRVYRVYSVKRLGGLEFTGLIEFWVYRV